MNPPIRVFRVLQLIVFGLLLCLPAEGAQRTRPVSCPNFPCNLYTHQLDCGRHLQATCSSGPSCDSGYTEFTLPPDDVVNISCSSITSGICSGTLTFTAGCYDPTNPPTCADCSANGQYQCPSACGGKCDAGLTPDSLGYCRPCGSYGEPICEDGEPDCEEGLTEAGGDCYSGCGGAAEVLCPNGSCQDWHFDTGIFICAACGGDPSTAGSIQSICPSGPACQPNVIQEVAVCFNCGQAGEPECDGIVNPTCYDGASEIGPDPGGTRICADCNGPGEVACDGSSCENILWHTQDVGLSGDLAECLFGYDTYERHFIQRNGVCWDGAPQSMTRTAPESWPVVEDRAPGRGTIFLIHGRGGSCGSGMDNVVAGQLHDTGDLVYCVEYAQENTPGVDRHDVRILPVLDDLLGNPQPSCTASNSCAFSADLAAEAVAPTYDVPGVVSGLSLAMQAVPTVGEITLVAFSQGGFIARELVYRHYDELRWRGKKISRVVTLAHPFYAKQTDPHLYTPWLCLADPNSFDCATGKWAWGWDLYAAGAIDNEDYPQIDWTIASGDSLNVPAGAPSVSPDDADGDGDTDIEDEQCLVIFGGIALDSVNGDSSVPIESTLGVDEFGTFNASELVFDRRYHTSCLHDGSCLLNELMVAPTACQAGSGLGQPLDTCYGTDPIGAILPSSGDPLRPVDVLDFDGVDDGVSIADPGFNIVQHMTLEAWVYIEEYNGGQIVNSQGEFWIRVVPGGQLHYALADGNWVSTVTDYIVPKREWTHIALVFDGVAGTTRLYANGRQEQQWSTGSTLGDVAPGLDDLDIGFQSTNPDRFSGRLDDLRVWDRSLTRAEVIAGLGGQPSNLSGLLGWWRFDQEGDSVVDSSGNGFHGSLTGLGTSAAPRRVRGARMELPGRALYLDGTGQHTVIDEPSHMTALQMTDAVTLEAWIYPRSDDVLNSIIVNKEGEYWLGRWSDGKVAWAIAGTSPGWVAVRSTYVAPLRQWTHISFVYDATISLARLYINGALYQEWAVAGTIGDVHSDDRLKIGTKSNGTDSFHGLIDEVRVWSVARDANQVASTWNRVLAAPLTETGLAGYWRLDGTGSVAFDSSGNNHHANLGNNNAAHFPQRGVAPNLPGYGLAYPGACGDGFIDPLETCDDAAVSGGDGCSAGCRLESVLDLQGDPTGGTVSIVVEGVTINVVTTDGQSLEDVAAALAAAIQADVTLASMGVTATSSGSQLFVGGSYGNLVVTDPGLMDCTMGLELPIVTGPIANTCPATVITLATDMGYPEYQWYFEGSPIAGANGFAYEASLTGNYRVRVGDGSGCQRDSFEELSFVSFCAGSEISPEGAVFPLRIEKDPASPTGVYAYFQNVDGLDGVNIYEGNLGSWYDHGAGPVCDFTECSVPNDIGCYDDLGTGELRAAVPTGAGGGYVLVSGYSGSDEGPVGYASDGTPRDPVQSTCLP